MYSLDLNSILTIPLLIIFLTKFFSDGVRISSSSSSSCWFAALVVAVLATVKLLVVVVESFVVVQIVVEFHAVASELEVVQVVD